MFSRASLLHVQFSLSSFLSFPTCFLLISLFLLVLLSAYTLCQALFSVQQKKRATCPAAMSYDILFLAADGVKEKESA